MLTVAMYQCSATLTSVPTTWLSDEVWAELDPRQARLPKQARRVLALAVALVAAATIAIGLGVASGEFGGNLYVPGWSIKVDSRTHSFEESVSIHNDSWFDETITGVGISGTGFRVTDWRPTHLTIAHGRTRTLHFRVQATDCAAVRAGEIHPVVRLERFWGTQSVALPVLDWTHGLQMGSEPLFNGPGWEACGKGG